MLSDQDLINLMVSEPSWEDVIVRIVAEEGMDPWDLDLVKLADSFADYVSRMDQMDLRIPARFILIAAVLLRMKSDILTNRPPKHALIHESDREQKDAELIRLLASVPPLHAPVKRVPLGSVSVEELVGALRKAFDVKERREKRKLRTRRRVEQVLAHEPDDINERIEDLLDRISSAIADIEGSTTFKSLVNKWERKDIVRTLIPMLHLTQQGKITHDQPVIFDEITVRKKKEVEA